MSSLDVSQAPPRPMARKRPRRRGMSPWEAVLVALNGLVANKLRSFLTMLGIIIGVASVILTVALGQGASAQSQEMISKLGVNALSVYPNQQRVGGVSLGLGSQQNLKEEDAEAILQQCPSVEAVAPEVSGRARAKYLNQNTSTNILGTTPEHFDIRNIKLAKGRVFTRADSERRTMVCVIGDAVRDALFGDRIEPIGKFLRIRGINFEVVGVAAYKGSTGFRNMDDQIWIPLGTAMHRVFGQNYLGSISVQGHSEEVMDKAQTEIEQLISRRHHQQPGDQPDVRIFSQADIQETAKQQSDMLTKLLTGIAAVSLLVGGIGIMNIMLVSVTERTREIGIRKAIGARWLDILNQFLIESVTLSLVGGVIGITTGVGGALLLNNYMPMLPTLPPVVMAFIFAAVVGVVFGVYPAMKAARLNPIDALRYE